MKLRNKSEIKAGSIEKTPAVVKGFGSISVTVVLGLILLPLGFLFGQIAQEIVSTTIASLIGAFLGLVYWLYKPVNPFSDNHYSPKPFKDLTPGELRALAHLHTAEVKWLTVKLSVAAALVPVSGAVAWKVGLSISGPIGTSVSDSTVDELFCVVALSALLAAATYHLVTYRILWNRWGWIQKHQPLPTPDILAKYAKGKAVAQWAHLYGTEYSEEMEKVLEGRPGKGFWKAAVRILGAGVAIISFINLGLGNVAEGRQLTILIGGCLGLLLFWLGGKIGPKNKSCKRSRSQSSS